jgi:DnaK suppressor protein
LKPAKKPIAKKPVAKKPVAKKPVAKKPVAKAKAPAKKPIKPAKKPIAKKPVAKAKAPVNKPVAKKPAPKPVKKAAVAPSKPIAKAPVSKKPEVKKPEANKSVPVAVKVPEKQIAPAPVAKPVRKGARAGYVKRDVVVEKALKQKSVRRVQLPSGYKPSDKEEYMNDYQLEYFRQKLLSERDNLLTATQETINELKEEARDVGDEAERASRETENFFELRTRDRYRKLLYKIDKIIATIDDGTYGYCVDTGEEIGIKRLEGRPMAERTVDAQERWEHKKKQLGD